jgi:propanol-preferring alcohol dehydrogenase
MRAMVLRRLVSLDETEEPLEPADLPVPVPGPGEILIAIDACGVCRTELDEIEGRAAPPRLPVVPGHEVVGRVTRLGRGVTRLAIGDRVGVGWIHSSSGADDENLSPMFRGTGRDVDGGYAEYMTVGEGYAHPVPAGFSDVEAAPLLCAGAVGYRALRLAGLRDGEPLGLTGFGGSGHLVLQMARHLYPASGVHVFARDPSARRFALERGAVWSGDTQDPAPEKLAAIIDTTPVWTAVVRGLGNLRPGGRLVINAIRKEEADKEFLLGLSYRDHLWMEREIKTVANITASDIRDCLALAAEIPIKPEVTTYRLEEANRALLDLKRGPVRGAKVLAVQQGEGIP